MYGQSAYDVSSAQNIILLLTFVVELFSGGMLVILGVFKVKTGSKKQVGAFMQDPLVAAGFVQMIIMGLVDMFSSLCCLMKVTANVMYGESEWITYLQFGVCTPPMLVVLCMVCSVDNDVAFGLAIMQAFIIICGYVGSVSPNNAFKFSWFVLGALMFISLFSVLLYMKRKATHEAIVAIQHSPTLKRTTSKKSKKEIETMLKRKAVLQDQKLSNRLIVITLVTWSLYPVTWLIIETDTITANTADIVHSALAFVAKVTFGYVLAYYRALMGYETLASTVLPKLPFAQTSNKDLGTQQDANVRSDIPNIIALDLSGGVHIRKSNELRQSIELMKPNALETSYAESL